MTARVLVAGIGNIFLRDDGFGPAVVSHLSAGELPGGVDVVDYGVRGMHLAYDLLEGCEWLVLVDAVPGQATPGTIEVIEVTEDHLGAGGFDAHAMDPLTVLSSLRALGGSLPTTFVVGCVPGDLDEGIGLSSAVAGAVGRAVTEVRALIADGLTPTVSSRMGGC